MAYKAFLQDIGYLQPEAADFQATTQNVDDEIARMAGPQLVVPVMNARFALNASNARWGSLYDALYGTDAISEADGAEKGKGYNKVRGDKVIAFARAFLDEAAPLASGSHVNSSSYAIVDGALQVTLKTGASTGLRDTAQLIGYHGTAAAPTAVLLKHNGLHFEIQIDAASPVGQTDTAGVKDVLMEAALTTIMDCEDSVAAVDADDKVVIYRNWLGLMKGDLSEQVSKGGQTFTRTMNPDREYTAPNGGTVSLHGRSLLFVRIIGFGPTAGVLAIALTYCGMLGKVYAEILESSDAHATDTLLANGSGRLAALLYGALPESASELMSYTVYRWECAIRGSVVMGFVGAGGLGQRMDESMKMLALRFGNILFEPLWRREWISDVQITIAEKLGVGNRLEKTWITCC